jgi:hypothetical protein
VQADTLSASCIPTALQPPAWPATPLKRASLLASESEPGRRPKILAVLHSGTERGQTPEPGELH